MNELTTANTIVSEFTEFFAPVEADLVASLIKQYGDKKAGITRVMNFVNDVETQTSMNYFVEASKRKNPDRGTFTLEYNEDDAVAELTAEFWQKAMTLTDVYDHMPQARRDEWHDMIRDRKCPPFTSDHVYPTLEDLLGKRAQFFAERVDGMFKALSGEHVTNSPSGFNKRMIIANVMDPKFLSSNWRVTGVLDDFRKVVAKFLNRDETIRTDRSGDLITTMTHCFGEWVEWDGGVIRAKLFKKGTVHLEVHPDIAWKLNEVLAYLYPKALSSSALKKPTKPSKEFNHIKTPLSGRVLDGLAFSNRVQKSDDRYQLKIPTKVSREITELVVKILESIGGVRGTYEFNNSMFGSQRTRMTLPMVEFDYNPSDVIARIICSGVVPDKKSHQFYPTPDHIALEAVRWCDVEPYHTVLEPSAGQGALAQLIDSPNLTCVEVSDLHCEILTNKELGDVMCDDFIDWGAKHRNEFDRVVMNPPFSDGRAKAHLIQAFECLKVGGVLVAILPASFIGKDIIDGVEHEYSDILVNEFDNTSVNTVMLKICK